MAEVPLIDRIRACRLCADRFAATATGHQPRPVVWFRPGVRILIAGQAPGARVHASGRPFTDPSGDRLRDWLGLNDAAFYDRDRIGIVPMAFCFPGHDARKSDLPPPPICARTWHAQVMADLKDVALTVLVGGHAHRWHLQAKTPVPETVPDTVTETVGDWRAHAPRPLSLATPVLAQYRVAEEKPVVRGRAFAGSAQAGARGSG